MSYPYQKDVDKIMQKIKEDLREHCSPYIGKVNNEEERKKMQKEVERLMKSYTAETIIVEGKLK